MDIVVALYNDFVRWIVALSMSIADVLSRIIGDATSQTSVQDPQTQQSGFLSLFERKYGTLHPTFYPGSFHEALEAARSKQRLVFVYLHAPNHPVTDSFCRETLCSELARNFLNANFVSWGSVVGSSKEGLQMAMPLNTISFPFCAVIDPASDDRMEVLQKVEGPMPPEQLVEILKRAIEEQGLALEALRMEEKIRKNQHLREQQDAAYLAALQSDKEKERAKQNARDAEARKKTMDKKVPEKIEREQSTSAKHLVPREDNPRRIPTTKKSNSKTKEIVKETGTSTIAQPHTKILVRFPQGQRKEKKFSPNDTIRTIYKFIDAQDIPGLGSYHLITNFPRQVYGHDLLDVTLKDAGLHPNAALFLELIQ